MQSFSHGLPLRIFATIKLSIPDPEEVPPYSPSSTQLKRQQSAMLMSPPTGDDQYENGDESQPLTSQSQQDTPTHKTNQMMVTPAVSVQSDCIQFAYFYFLLFIKAPIQIIDNNKIITICGPNRFDRGPNTNSAHKIQILLNHNYTLTNNKHKNNIIFCVDWIFIANVIFLQFSHFRKGHLRYRWINKFTLDFIMFYMTLFLDLLHIYTIYIYIR